MRRIWLRAALAASVVAMAVAGCGRKEEASPQRVQPAQPVVQVSQPVAKTAPEEEAGFQVIAVLEGASRTEVASRVRGYLIRQDYQDGALVKQGDVLFEMDARPFEAALEKAKANLADKEAHAASRGDVDAVRAAVTAAQADLAATKIIAPVGGMAGKAAHGLGDWIEPGAVLTTISGVDPMKAVFTLPKKFYLDHADRIAKALALAPEARPVTLDLVLADGTIYARKGRWESMGGAVSASMGPVASAVFANPDGMLKPGEYVRVGESGNY